MLSSLLTIALLYAGALVSPGPNILLVTQLAASGGRAVAVPAALGIAFGGGIWSGSVVLGLPALFAAVPLMRLAMPLAGALYLLFLAGRLWRSGVVTAVRAAQPSTGMVAFRVGLLTTLTNPKSLMFFASVFATALPPTPPAQLKLAAVALIIVSASAWYGLLGVLFSRPPVREAYARHAQLLGRIAAVVLGSLAAAMLVGGIRTALETEPVIHDEVLTGHVLARVG